MLWMCAATRPPIPIPIPRAIPARLLTCVRFFGCAADDVMIDTQLKPWLLEVNASPSLSTTTPSDKALKMALIGEVLDIVLPPSFFEQGGVTRASATAAPTTGASSGAHTGRRRFAPEAAATAEASASDDGGPGTGKDGSGGFEILYDEAVELDAERQRREAADGTRGKRPQSALGSRGRHHGPSWAP